MHTRAWDTTSPDDSRLAGSGGEELRNIKTDIKERLAVNHNMGGELNPDEINVDGAHSIITLAPQPAPSIVPDGGCILQCTTKDGLPELCKYHGNPAVEVQITKNNGLYFANLYTERTCFLNPSILSAGAWANIEKTLTITVPTLLYFKIVRTPSGSPVPDEDPYTPSSRIIITQNSTTVWEDALYSTGTLARTFETVCFLDSGIYHLTIVRYAEFPSYAIRQNFTTIVYYGKLLTTAGNINPVIS